MTDLQVRAICAGVFFGIWPLLMSKSGLNGYSSGTAFCFFALIVVAPFAYWSTQGLFPEANWKFAIVAGVLGGIGILFFNSMLASAPAEKMPLLFVLATVVQITVPALYQVYVSGGVTLKTSLGFVAAIAAGFLLT